jgi:hypothetical protein
MLSAPAVFQIGILALQKLLFQQFTIGFHNGMNGFPVSDFLRP